jgi:uncharacterized protein (TIGR03435 family)
MRKAFRIPYRRAAAINSANVVIRLSVVAAACVPLVWADGAILSAQVTPAAVTVTPPKFDVATIKRNVSGGSQIGTVFQPDGHYRAFNVRVRDLVSEAYRVRGFQVAGGPSWVDSERFDIEAKTEDAANFAFVVKADGFRTLPETPFLMLRELLKDRFKLVVHRETREGPVYALTMIRSGVRGPGLRPPEVNCATLDPKDPSPKVGLCEGIRRAPGRFMARTVTMTHLATSLSILLQRLVIDRTGLSERFDFDLEWKPIDSAVDPSASPAAEFAPSLLAALDERLGLKLESQRAPIEYVVIDSAEPSTEN